MTRFPTLLPLIALTALAACQQRDLVLPGTRLDPREIVSPEGPAVEGPAGVSSTALNLSAPVSVEWTARAANPAHRMPHAALAGSGQQRLWSAPIGEGSARRYRITADPVVAGGRAFTLDSRAQVVATALNGGTVWRRDLTPAAERGDSA